MSSLVYLFLSCQAEKHTNTNQTPPLSERDTAYIIFDTAEIETVSVNIEEITELVQNHVDSLRTFDTSKLIQDIYAIMSESDAECPQIIPNGDQPYWADQCTSEFGAQYEGYGSITEYTDALQEDGSISTGQHYYGEGQLTSSTGESILTSGSIANIYNVQENGTEIYSSYLYGAYYKDEETGWAGWNYSPQFGLSGAKSSESGQKIFFGQAEIETAESVLFIDEIFMTNDVFGQCAIEPGAVMSIFTEETGWLELKFDGPNFENWESDMSLCDGCGTLSQFGTDLGEVCVDFSSLLNWTDTPWL